LNKPAGIWCEHCNVGKGCGIYGNHPPGCKDFACQWLLGEDSENKRPDLVQIVTDQINLPEIGITTMLFEVEEGALSGVFATAKTLIEIREGSPVCQLPLRGKNKLFISRNIWTSSGYSIRIDNKDTEIFHV